MKKNTRQLLIVAFVFVIIDLFFIEEFLRGAAEDALFHEAVEFGAFHNVYEQDFVISEDTDMHVTVSSKIEKGSIYFKLTSENGSILYEAEGGSLNLHETIPVQEGLLNYYFECSLQKGDYQNSAENGSYEILLELAE